MCIPIYFRIIYVVLYVDDMLLIGKNKEIIMDVKTQMFFEFYWNILVLQILFWACKSKEIRKIGTRVWLEKICSDNIAKV